MLAFRRGYKTHCLCIEIFPLNFWSFMFDFMLLAGWQVSVSGKLYDFIHFLWLNEAPVGELQ
jgi:hypothetical protein